MHNEKSSSSSLTVRQKIRASWVNYIKNTTYDITRAIIDFTLEGVLKPPFDYAQAKSETDNQSTKALKTTLGTVTGFIRPKTLALSHGAGSIVSFFTSSTIGYLIGQVAPKVKQSSYNLDKNNLGAINNRTTKFATDYINFMLLGSLASVITAQYLPVNSGSLLYVAANGALVGFIGKRLANSWNKTKTPIPKIGAEANTNLPKPEPEVQTPDNSAVSTLSPPIITENHAATLTSAITSPEIHMIDEPTIEFNSPVQSNVVDTLSSYLNLKEVPKFELMTVQPKHNETQTIVAAPIVTPTTTTDNEKEEEVIATKPTNVIPTGANRSVTELRRTFTPAAIFAAAAREAEAAEEVPENTATLGTRTLTRLAKFTSTHHS